MLKNKIYGDIMTLQRGTVTEAAMHCNTLAVMNVSPVIQQNKVGAGLKNSGMETGSCAAIVAENGLSDGDVNVQLTIYGKDEAMIHQKEMLLPIKSIFNYNAFVTSFYHQFKALEESNDDKIAGIIVHIKCADGQKEALLNSNVKRSDDCVFQKTQRVSSSEQKVSGELHRLEEEVSKEETQVTVFNMERLLTLQDVKDSTNDKTGDDVFMEKLFVIIESNHADSGFGAEQLAHELGMSRMQLHRKLKGIAGQSACYFLRYFRLRRARKLLRRSDLQISEVAYLVGFNNLSYFTKVFKEFTGFTPSDFVENV
jgi:AraC-like DNA-binding protein